MCFIFYVFIFIFSELGNILEHPNFGDDNDNENDYFVSAPKSARLLNANNDHNNRMRRGSAPTNNNDMNNDNAAYLAEMRMFAPQTQRNDANYVELPKKQKYYSVTFDKPPFGIGIASVDNNRGAIVTTVKEELRNTVFVGSVILRINGEACKTHLFNNIKKKLCDAPPETSIRFRFDPVGTNNNQNDSNLYVLFFICLVSEFKLVCNLLCMFLYK